MAVWKWADFGPDQVSDMHSSECASGFVSAYGFNGKASNRHTEQRQPIEEVSVGHPIPATVTARFTLRHANLLANIVICRMILCIKLFLGFHSRLSTTYFPKAQCVLLYDDLRKGRSPYNSMSVVNMSQMLAIAHSMVK